MHDEILSMEQRGAQALFSLAQQARMHAVCPYSGYAVGAALLDETGRVWLGANIENSAYSPTICAERVALAKAVFDGARHFVMIAVAGGNLSSSGLTPGDIQDCTPCGVCRQALSEFFAPQTLFVFMTGGQLQMRRMDQILPDAFVSDMI